MRDEITPAARAILARARAWAAVEVELFRSGDGVTSFRPAVRPSVVGPAAGSSFSSGRAMSLNGGETSAGVTDSNRFYPSTDAVGEQFAADIRRRESAGDLAGSFSRSATL